ncbi:MAG TPA: four helix bundle protein [Nitrospirae bacterium]|nr:four helix bundle protein [Nitrospirota bacterium]
MRKKIEGFEDLEVYRKLCDLHIEVNELSFTFPKFELYELGSQVRRSSNSSPANVAEGWNNKHINIYLEGINRAQGELRETKHHLKMAFRKGYIEQSKFTDLISRYDECGRMLKALEKSLNNWRSKNL